MMREFFKALAGDVASGKAKVAWEEKGLAVQKRLVGAYGMTSDTLVEQLRKRSSAFCARTATTSASSNARAD